MIETTEQKVTLQPESDTPKPKKRGRKPGTKNKATTSKKREIVFDVQKNVEMLFKKQDGLIAKNRPIWEFEQVEIETLSQAVNDFIEESGGIENLSAKHTLMITAGMIMIPRFAVEIVIFTKQQKLKKQLAKPQQSNGTIRKPEKPEKTETKTDGKKESNP